MRDYRKLSCFVVRSMSTEACEHRCALARRRFRSMSQQDKQLSHRFNGRMPVHRHVAGLIDDAVEPGADCGKGVELEVALVREVRVAVERNVGDGIVAGGEEVVPREMLLHHTEGL